MELTALKYSKEEGDKELRDIGHGASEPTDGGNIPHNSEEEIVAGKIETKIIFIISGGMKRECDYFHFVKKDLKRPTVKIAFASKKGQGLNPSPISSMADDFISKRRFWPSDDSSSFSIQPGDIIYLLQDMDEFETQILTEMKNPIEQTRWIVSNPCFEIWLYYHKFDTPEKLADGISVEVAKRSQWLRGKLNELKEGGFNPLKLHEKMREAIDNSLANFAVKENGLPDVYSTQMHIVAEQVLKALGDEFDKMIANRKAQASAFKAKALGIAE